jgi:death-on-curing protein
VPGHFEPDFLTVEDLLDIHVEVLEAFGGEAGVRDLGLLESAVAQPQASFDGVYLHDDLFLMAAAYLFHITQNHALIDGNKRTGLVAALTFLRLNGVAMPPDLDIFYDLTIGVATGMLNKTDVAAEFRRLAENELPETAEEP